MTDRRNPYRNLDSVSITSFLNGRTVATAERISTGKSNTNYKLELSDGQIVVLRLYSENGSGSPQRDARIAKIIDGRVPIPAILDYGKDWAVFEFAPGSTLDSKPENTAAAAEVLAHLSEIKFDVGGWIEPDGLVTPFDFDGFGDDYVGSMLVNPAVQRWLDPITVQKLRQILAKESTRRSEISAQPVMVHGDFNPTNILIDSSRVSAVIDWEYAHAGSPYMDIGNLLRNTDPQFHEAIRAGLTAGGFDVPDDWKERAALVDLSSHIEFLSSLRSDEFKRTRVELIQVFIRMFEPV
jgi:aminoglycoside phosphotransferase (APT) family kinase protein